MPLPNTGMSFTPFDPLPASDLNDLVENIEALADGSGLNTGAVTPTQRSGGFYAGTWDASGVGTGTGKTITGIGFTPKALLIVGNDRATSTQTATSAGYCYYTGSAYTQGYQATGSSSSGYKTITSSTQAFGSTTQTTAQFQGTVTGFSSGTITVNVTTNTASSDYCKFHIMVLG